MFCRNQLKTRLTKKVEISKILRAVEDVKSCIRVQLLGNKFLKSRLKSHRNKKVEDIVNVKSISYSEVSTIKEEFNTNFNSGITIFPAAENSATDMPDTETASIEMSVNCTKPELECAVTKMTQNLDSLISFENRSDNIKLNTLNNMDYTFLESANPFKILDQSTENITINNESNFIITAFRSSMAEPIKSILRHKDATKHIDLSLIRVASRKRVRFQLEEIIDSIENLNISTNSNFTIEKQFSKKYKTNQK
jgi:hypothetical protein